MISGLMLLLLLVSLANADVREKLRQGLKPSSSDYPGLEAPLEGAAASPESRMSGSHHDDEDNLDRLCNDPFHSFLCKPVGPRRMRLDGRLRPGAVLPPGVFQPAASSLSEALQPFGAGSNPQSSFQGMGYLPPPGVKPPIQEDAQYLPPKVAEPSSPSTSYLPPLKNPSPVKLISQTESPFKTVKEKQEISETRETPVKKTPSKPSLHYLPIADQNSSPESTNLAPVSKPSNKYLPIDEPNVSPDSTNISPSIKAPLLASAAENRQRTLEENHSLERLCNDPFHSFLCKPTKQRKRIDGRIRSGAKIPPNVLQASGSIAREAKVLAPDDGITNSASNPDIQSPNQLATNTKPSLEEQPKSSGRDPQGSFGGYHYQQPSEVFTSSTSKPIYNGNGFAQASNNQVTVLQTTTHAYSRPSSFNGYFYQKPHSTFSTPTQYSTTYTTPKPINSFQNSVASNIQQNIVSPSGYHYIRPSNGLSTRPPTQPSGASSNVVTQRPSFSYIYPGSTTQGGYTYKKPTVPFSTAPTFPTTPSPETFTTLSTASTPSQIALVQLSTTTTKPNIYQYQSPSNAQQTFIQTSNGYKYPKPSSSFPNDATTSALTYFIQTTTTIKPPSSTASVNNYFYQTSTAKPFGNYQKPSYTHTNQFAKPTNVQETVVSSSGYNYPKPSHQLGLPTENKPVVQTYPTRPSTTQKPSFGYQYQRPTNFQQTSQTGYVYNKPTFTSTPIPQYTQSYTTTAQRPVTTTIRPIQNNNYQSPTNIQQNIVSPNGYKYPKPSNIFTLPTKKPYETTQSFLNSQRPIFGYQESRPTNIQQHVVNPSQGGYIYPKPSYTYPTTQKPTTIFAFQTNPTSTALTTVTTDVPTTTYSTTVRPTFSSQYAKPSNIQQSFFQPGTNGYSYPKPQFTQISTITTPRPTAYYTTKRPTVGYQQAKPTNIQQSVISPSQNGYHYQRPQQPFTLPTQTYPTIITTSRPPLTSGPYAKPSNLQQNVVVPAKRPGYSYPRPSTAFNYPTTEIPYESTVTTTALPTTTTESTTVASQYQQASNLQQNIAAQPPQQTGYQYPKPSVGFPYPQSTTSRTLTYTRPVNGFQYPKPTPNQQQPSNHFQQQASAQTQISQAVADQGYSYPKPARAFTLPSRNSQANNGFNAYHERNQFQPLRNFEILTH